jgi:uncharacterized membrane protein YbjE (DUF340 family)
MKSSLIILGVFALGIFTGLLSITPQSLDLDNLSMTVLYMLMFLVGISLGLDKHIWEQLREMNLKLLLIPISTLTGTALGIIAYQLLFSFPKGADLYAIGAGFGYYSFSSIYINKVSGETMGIIALLANISREVITLVFTPVIVKYFGKIAPIACGGATTSDTTLPVILKYSGKEYVLGSVLNGVILTVLVPIVIAFIYGL